ncbi:RnfH family protein [Halotalea alkalilenta]|uniref:RnfH family protein n=1 Tax=Halotalea alkalilenta TaxID=376489 RepID=UPI00138E067E|nr:RnfH family protein [Halotalea alkalilenta]
MVAEENIRVEIALAAGGEQRLVSLSVAAGTTIRQAFVMAGRGGALGVADERWLAEAPLGVFGERIREPETETVSNGDRIEVYSPLKVDPKSARRARAKDR